MYVQWFLLLPYFYNILFEFHYIFFFFNFRFIYTFFFFIQLHRRNHKTHFVHLFFFFFISFRSSIFYFIWFAGNIFVYSIIVLCFGIFFLSDLCVYAQYILLLVINYCHVKTNHRKNTNSFAKVKSETNEDGLYMSIILKPTKNPVIFQLSVKKNWTEKEIIFWFLDGAITKKKNNYGTKKKWFISRNEYIVLLDVTMK